MNVLTRNVRGNTYPLLDEGEVSAALACADGYGIVDAPDDTLVVAEHGREGGESLGAWMRTQRERGRAIVLQMPDFQQLPAEHRPPRAGIDLFCEPHEGLGVQPAALSTISLHEALGFLAGSGSLVLLEPADGWIEQRSDWSSRLGWGGLALAGGVVAVSAWWLLGR